jgi:hypothetical protein
VFWIIVSYLLYSVIDMSSTGLKLSHSNSQQILIKDGWFTESETMWPGQRFCIQVEEVLVNGRSEFQVLIIYLIK